MGSAQPLAIMVVTTFVIYLISRVTLNGLFRLLQRTFYRDRAVYILIAIFFFPGTLLHELAHYLAAVALLLEVKSIHLLPEWKGNELKLGKVIYIRRDFLRGILVGVAPVAAGILFFFVFSVFEVFPSSNIWVNAGSVYLILVVSTMMFSSRQDLLDFIYLLPVLILAAAAVLFFRIRLDTIPLSKLFAVINPYVDRVNSMLYVTAGVHAVAAVLLRIINRRRE